MRKIVTLFVAAAFAGLSYPLPSCASEESIKLPAKIKQAPDNTFVKICEGASGDRTSPGLIFSKEHKRFLLFGGNMDMRSGKSPFDQMTLNLEKGVWENHFPEGKLGAWGDLTGPSKAPGFGRGKRFVDTKGNARPNLHPPYYRAMYLYNNYAYDSHRKAIVAIYHLEVTTKRRLTVEYDLSKRGWRNMEKTASMPQDFWDGVFIGQMCYDPVNKEVIGGQFRWGYRDGGWRKLEYGSELINSLRARVKKTWLPARNLVGACRARFYLAESPAEEKNDLSRIAANIEKETTGLLAELEKAGGETKDAYETKQIGWAKADLGKAFAILKKLATELKGTIKAETIWAAEDARDALDAASVSLAVVPPRRGFSPLVYAPKFKKMVLFGGHALDLVLADTWIYDCVKRRWEQARPKLSPRPRYAHGMTWLPKSGKVLLVDGLGYGTRKKTDGELWTYDVAANSWQVLSGQAKRKSFLHRSERSCAVAAAASDSGDLLLARSTQWDKAWKHATWAARIDASKTDEKSTTERGVPFGTVKSAGRQHDDPRWYEQQAGIIDKDWLKNWLTKLPVNKWTFIDKCPNRPYTNRAWGTHTFDPERMQMLSYGGGHVAFTGNTVLQYSLRSNRCFIGHRPEFALVNGTSGSGGSQVWTYKGRTLIPGHSFNHYDYDPLSRRMITVGSVISESRPAWLHFFSFDPYAGDFDQKSIETPFRGSTAGTHTRVTPKGLVAWSVGQLWLLNPSTFKWKQLPLKGILPPAGYAGFCYDSKRNRLLLYSARRKPDRDIVAYDMESGVAAPLSAKGRSKGSLSREPVYVPEHDVVLAASKMQGKDGKWCWMLYDCEKNAYFTVFLGEKDPISFRKKTGVGNVSLGMRYDAKNKVIWTIDAYARVWCLKLDPKKADLKPIE